MIFSFCLEPVWFVSTTLPFITACNPFPRNVNIRSSKSLANATNAPISSISRILQGNFLPKRLCNLSKYFIPDLFCNIPTKHNHRSICKSVQAFEPVVVNVNFVSVPACHLFHVVKSIFLHQFVSSLAKPIFLTADTVTDTL